MESGACGGDRESLAIEGRFHFAAAAEEKQAQEASAAASGVKRIGLWDFSSEPRYLGYITAEGPDNSFFLRAGYLVRTSEAADVTVAFRRASHPTGLVFHGANVETPVEAEYTAPETERLHHQVACPKVKRGIHPTFCESCPYWANGTGLWLCTFRRRTVSS